MGVTIISGFETGSGHAEGLFLSNVGGVTTSLARTGSYSLGFNIASFLDPGGYINYNSRAAGGTQRNIAQSARFYLRITTMPSFTGSQKYSVIAQTGNGTTAAGTQVALNDSGNLIIAGGNSLDGAVTSSDALSTGQWYKISFDASGTNRTLYVDDVQWAQATGRTTASAQTAFRIGFNTNDNINLDIVTAALYFDDLLVDDSSFGGSGPSGNILLLLPTADPGSLNSWTNGGGGTTSIFEGVNNIPPVGVAASTNGTKIKNAASGSNLDYVATMQTYTAAGVPSGATINAVMAICNDGEEVTTGTKAGGIWIASNPSQTAGGNTFDYGNDTATVVGTFPTGWTPHLGPVTSSPSVTLGTAPTVTVRKTGSTTRVVDVDLLGLYVDYTPLPVAKQTVVLQSVKRTSLY